MRKFLIKKLEMFTKLIKALQIKVFCCIFDLQTENDLSITDEESFMKLLSDTDLSLVSAQNIIHQESMILPLDQQPAT